MFCVINVRFDEKKKNKVVDMNVNSCIRRAVKLATSSDLVAKFRLLYIYIFLFAIVITDYFYFFFHVVFREGWSLLLLLE